MEKYYLAVDIGASGGRHILGTVREGKLVLQEICRFNNGMKRKDGHLCWAVDFVLLDGENRMLGNATGYRDDRTKGMDEKLY